MAKDRLSQVTLTSGNDTTLPAFPCGWIISILDRIQSFSTEASKRSRTNDRIKGGQPVFLEKYQKAEAQFTQIVTALFPNVSTINDFAKKYVNEYFRLWKTSAEAATIWAKHQGYEIENNGVLTLAFVRDLLLRLAYLECCERALSHKYFNEEELALLDCSSPQQAYGMLVNKRRTASGISSEKLAEDLGIDDRQLRRIKAGEALPDWTLLKKIQHPQTDLRLLSGIRFMDTLLRNLDLSSSTLAKELFSFIRIYLPSHHRILSDWNSKSINSRSFHDCANIGDNLLLHPDIESVLPEIQNPLWRVHLYALKFARFPDLAQAYLQFCHGTNTSELEQFLACAEDESCCLYGWMRQLILHQQ